MLSDVTSTDSHHDDGDSVTNDTLLAGETNDEEDLPVYLWRPSQTTSVVGEWEQHTRVSNHCIFHFITCCYLVAPRRSPHAFWARQTCPLLHPALSHPRFLGVKPALCVAPSP